MSIYSFPEPFEKEILSSNPLSKTSKSLTRPSVWVSNFRPQVCFWWLRGWWMGWWMIPSLKLTAKAPENKPFQKDHFISQPLIFRGELLVSGREAPRNLANGISPPEMLLWKRVFLASTVCMTGSHLGAHCFVSWPFAWFLLPSKPWYTSWLFY